MILYHGSYLAIENPDLLHSRPNLDFGKGFYLTSIREQAVKWCERFEDLFQRLKVLQFDTYSEEWLVFILACRSGKDSSDYDAVCGGIANEKPNMQIVFRTDAALNCLRYMGCEKI